MNKMREALLWAALDSRRRSEEYRFWLQMVVAMALFLIALAYPAVAWLISGNVIPLLVFLILVLLTAVGLIIPIRSPRAPTSWVGISESLAASWREKVNSRLPNSQLGDPALAAFLVRLQDFGATEWRSVVERLENHGWRFWRDILDWRRKSVALRTIGRIASERTQLAEVPIAQLLERAAREGVIPFVPPYSEYWATQEACAGLIYRESLKPEEFQVLYAPFESVMPFQSLVGPVGPVDP